MKGTDRYEIGFGARDKHGAKLEPEQQPVRHVVESKASVNTNGEEPIAAPAIPLVVTAEMDASEAEALLYSQCRFCVHWRQDEYKRDRISGRLTRVDVDRQRAEILDRADLDDVELSAQDVRNADALLDASIGKCMALTDALKDLTYTQNIASCPEAGPNGQPLPLFFQPRPDAKKLRAQVHDAMMRRAQGKDST